MNDGYGVHATRPRGFDIGPDEDRLMPVNVISLDDNLEIQYEEVYIARPPYGGFQEPLDEGPCPPGYVDASRTLTYATDKKYHSEVARLQTFEDRWLDDYHVKAKDLARDGFIHIGPRDKVKCVFCLKSLRNWEPNDSVEAEHRKHYPDCPFINGKCHDLNIPINPAENMKKSFGPLAETSVFCICPYWLGLQYHVLNAIPIQPPSRAADRRLTMKTSEQSASQRLEPMNDFSFRLKSYESWPKSAPVRPDALAEAGLYYTGTGDNVRCFVCEKMIDNWEYGDDPWVEHAKWSPHCSYVHSVKGSAYIKQIQKHETEDTNSAGPMEISCEPVNSKKSNDSQKEETVRGSPFKAKPVKHSVQVSSAQIDEDLNSAPVKAVCDIYDVPLEKMRQMLQRIRITKGTEHKVTAEDFKEMTDFL